ncbi:MAG: FAD-binding protein [Burkholderiales bacterium]|nr:FAD-binding protein [Burkholderiales bacterium]
MIEIDPGVLQCDVLVAGGGMAGLMAAIGAARQGAKVVVAEKAHALRSGSGATGNDHFMCYIPEKHGPDIEPILKELLASQIGGFHDTPLSRKFLEQSFDRARDWESFGIDMRPTGEWSFCGHAFPGRPRIWLKYAGSNQKLALTRAAKKLGVRTVNYLPIVDVVVEKGRVIGAIGLDVSSVQPRLRLVRTAAVVLAGGSAIRLYPSPAPSLLFNTAWCPACTGNTQAIAWRSGAKLANMEFPNLHAGVKYLERAGKATFIGVITGPDGKPLGPFITKADKWLGDITADVWNSVFGDVMKSGEGPAYMDCTATDPADIEYMMWGLKEEGNTALVNLMGKEGVDLRRHRLEFMQYQPFLIGRGPEIDLHARTRVQGLYAAGDAVGNFRADMAGAATFGHIAGEAAARDLRALSPAERVEDSALFELRRSQFSAFLARAEGAAWKEANFMVQQIMRDYANAEVRSETLLSAGLKYLGDLGRRAMDTVRCANAHELMRMAEVMELMDCAEAIFVSALARRETRGTHRRSDYRFTNPLLADKFLTAWRESGRPTVSLRPRITDIAGHDAYFASHRPPARVVTESQPATA